MESQAAAKLGETLKKYRSALYYLDACGALTLEKIQKAHEIAGIDVPVSQLRVEWEQADGVLPRQGQPGGKEYLRFQLRRTLQDAIATFEGLSGRLRRPLVEGRRRSWWAAVLFLAIALSLYGGWVILRTYRMIGFGAFPVRTHVAFAADILLALVGSAALLFAAIAVLRRGSWGRWAVLGGSLLLGSEIMSMVAELFMGSSLSMQRVAAWVIEAPRNSPLIVIRTALAFTAVGAGALKGRRLGKGWLRE